MIGDLPHTIFMMEQHYKVFQSYANIKFSDLFNRVNRNIIPDSIQRNPSVGKCWSISDLHCWNGDLSGQMKWSRTQSWPRFQKGSPRRQTVWHASKPLGWTTSRGVFLLGQTRSSYDDQVLLGCGEVLKGKSNRWGYMPRPTHGAEGQLRTMRLNREVPLFLLSNIKYSSEIITRIAKDGGSTEL